MAKVGLTATATLLFRAIFSSPFAVSRDDIDRRRWLVVLKAPAVLPSQTPTDLRMEKQTNINPLSQHHSPKTLVVYCLRRSAPSGSRLSRQLQTWPRGDAARAAIRWRAPKGGWGAFEPNEKPSASRPIGQNCWWTSRYAGPDWQPAPTAPPEYPSSLFVLSLCLV
jgi:hypothetical protein